MTHSKFMQNREISWLKFNERVLEKGRIEDLARYERLKFVSIFESNLTEFFMVRVGGLKDLVLLNKEIRDNKTKMTPKQQLDAIYKETRRLYKLKDETYQMVEESLREKGVSNLKFHELNEEERDFIVDYFKTDIRPLLSPNLMNKMHPFPFIENKILYIFAEVSLKNKSSFLILPIRDNLPEYVRIKDSNNYILMEEIIYNLLDQVLENYKINKKYVIKITRNADINLEPDTDDDEDYRLQVKKILKKRNRLAPVRLETNQELSNKSLKFLLKNLGLSEDEVFLTKSPLSLGYVWSLPHKLDHDLMEEISLDKFTPRISNMVDPKKSLIYQVEQNDILLSYPYESMDSFLNLVREASTDPRVYSIKITIYRLASNSRLIKHLLRAAEEGKEVTAVMELRARFDEHHNIDYSEELISGGVNVLYGIEHYKVHSKVCLISYKDQGQLKYITHIGTGNYNESTAKLYQDMNIITADRQIGLDARDFFNNLQISKIDNYYDKLLQAPSGLKKKIIELIERESKKGEQGYIRMKCNSVTDKKIIEKLSMASKAGVKVDMVVRGICCILPGVEGETDNIRIISIVGRFLEHARIYQFGRGKRADVFISSADMMTRNTEKRVEIACPVFDPDIKRYLMEFLDNQFRDTVNAKELKSDGLYIPVKGDELFDSHQYYLDTEFDYLERTYPEKKKETKKQAVSQEKEENKISIWQRIKNFFSK